MMKARSGLARAIKPIRPQDRFLVFGAPSIGEREIQEVIASLTSGWIGMGPKVVQFEAAFARYKGVRHAAAVSSCTAALHLSLLAAGISAGDEVITTPLTFCATINAIRHAGAVPILADVEAATMNLDPPQVRRRITPRTRAILPVHFAGRPCRMEQVMFMAREHGLKVIEDCAHAIEAEDQHQQIGTVGDFGCFSFYATKSLTTSEGGMVLAKRLEDLERIRTLAMQGLSKGAWQRFADTGYQHYQVVEAGFKYNMTDLQAAIGLHQLPRLEERWQRRKAIWERYQQAFAFLPVTRPADPEPEIRHAYHLYTLLIDEERAGISRDQFIETMTAHHIGVGVHYVSIPEHPYYQRAYGWTPEAYPEAMKIGRQTVSLPFSAALTDADVEDVILAVRMTLEVEKPL